MKSATSVFHRWVLTFPELRFCSTDVGETILRYFRQSQTFLLSERVSLPSRCSSECKLCFSRFFMPKTFALYHFPLFFCSLIFFLLYSDRLMPRCYRELHVFLTATNIMETKNEKNCIHQRIINTCNNRGS